RQVCAKSYDCRNREVKVFQHRTDCNQDAKGRYKCLRMVEIEVTKTMKSMDDPDYLVNPARVSEEKIDWNKATPADLTNFSVTLGYMGRTPVTKEINNISGSGLYLALSKRLFSFMGVEIAAGFVRGESTSQNLQKSAAWDS